MKRILTPLRVGILVLVSAALFIAFMAFARKGGLSASNAVDLHAYFKDASGISKKSRVQIAGIGVGEVRDIVLEGTRAKILLRVKNEVQPRQNAKLVKRSESLLGDYVIDLDPGSEPSPLLKDGDEIKNVVDSQGMTQVFNTLDKITADIQSVTGALRSALGGEKGADSLEHIVQNLTRVSDNVDRTVARSSENVDAILENLRTVSGDIKGITQGEDQSLRTIVENIRFITTDVREVAAQVRQVVGENEGDLKGSAASLRQTLARLDHTLENLDTVTTKVRNGEGPVGKLLADEHLSQKISETVDDVSNFASRLTGIQAEVDIGSDYLIAQAASKTTLGIKLITHPDRYYLLELVDDPRGNVSTEIVQSNPPSAGQPTVQTRTTTQDSLKFSAEFAKRFYFATLRVGIIENTGGVGADLHFIKDMFTFKVDAFNFSVTALKFPRLRSSLRFQAFNHLYVNAGMDDILNAQVRDTVLTHRLIAGRDFFAGGGIYFTDDDLKSLIALTGVPKP